MWQPIDVVNLVLASSLLVTAFGFSIPCGYYIVGACKYHYRDKNG